VQRWPRPAVAAAIGPAAAQTRRLSQLPPTSDARMLSALVRESAGRFFLKNGIPLVTTHARAVGVGEAWVAAFEEPVVTAVELACRRRKVRLTAVFPAVVVIAHALDGASIQWRDGDVLAEAAYDDDGQLSTTRRLPLAALGGAASDGAHAPPVPELARLGEDAWRFADAFGAALAPMSEPIAYRVGAGSARAAVPRRRLVVAALACALAIATALLTPGVVATRTASRAARRLTELSEERRAAAATDRALLETTSALSAIAALDRDRRSITLFLASMTRALPATTTLTSLRVDSVGGELVAHAPRGAAVVTQLEALPEIAGSALVGPVTPDVTETRRLERVTVRFQWRSRPAGAPRRTAARGAR
jgi:hypothetical protein